MGEERGGHCTQKEQRTQRHRGGRGVLSKSRWKKKSKGKNTQHTHILELIVLLNLNADSFPPISGRFNTEATP